MSHNMSFINKFKVFSELDQQLVNNIKLFYLTKQQLVFTTENNSVFYYDLNQKQIKFFDAIHENEVIIKFDCCYPSDHFLLLTNIGRVFGWKIDDLLLDENNIYEDKSFSINSDDLKPINILSDHFITDICCGDWHLLVLTSNSIVFAFGSDSFGQCFNVSNNKILLKIELPNVIAISCNICYSVALTENGEVFVWGSIKKGESDINDNITYGSPTKLAVPKTKIVISGDYFTLMLSTEGDIYFCGHIYASYSRNVPTKIKLPTKFTDIGATISSNLCVALSINNKCFVFGNDCELQQTDFKSIDETFAQYDDVTYKTVQISESIYRLKFDELCALGTGAFSTVFKCECKLDNKFYAIKKVCFESEQQESVIKELKILSKLNSEYVVKFIDSWIEPNYYIGSYNAEVPQNISSSSLLYSPNKPHLLHIQMELCSMTLRDAINIIMKECKKTYSTSLIGYYISSEILYEILECVNYLHSQNPAIIHRDLKPENILLTNFINKRFIKLSDFGLSTFHEFADQSHTKYTGTKNYRAFEVNTTKRYTTKADVYSLGVIIQELFDIDINDKYAGTLIPWGEIRQLSFKSLNPSSAFRPDCKSLLDHHFQWRIKHKQLISDSDFCSIALKIPKSKSIDENFIEHFIQNKFKFNIL